MRLAGCAHIDNTFAVGIHGDAVPLELEVLGAEAPRVTWLPALSTPALLEDRLLLPLPTAFESWLRLPANATVVLSCCAETGLIEFELAAYRPATTPEAHPEGPHVQVFDLSALLNVRLREANDPVQAPVAHRA